MDLEKNEAIARRFNEACWTKGKLDVIDELASPEITLYYPALPQAINGIDAFKQHRVTLQSIFSDAKMQIEDEIAEGDKVVLRWTWSATHQAEFPPGVPATGKKLKWTGITIFHIVDGKVVEQRAEEDYLSALRQLGLIPAPQAQ